MPDWQKIGGFCSFIAVILAVLALMGFTPQQSQVFLQALSQYFQLIFYLFIAFLIVWLFGQIQANITRQVYSHLQVWYFGRHNDPRTAGGESLVIIGQKRRAYLLSPKVEELVKSKLVNWNTEPCLTRTQWLRRHRMELYDRAVPRDDELLEGSPSRYVPLFRLVYHHAKH